MSSNVDRKNRIAKYIAGMVEPVMEPVSGRVSNSTNTGRSKPCTSRSANRLWSSTPCAWLRNAAVPNCAKVKLSSQNQKMYRLFRFTMRRPAEIRLPSSVIENLTLLNQPPGEELCKCLAHEIPVVGQLARGLGPGFGGAAVVEVVAIKVHFVFRVEFHGFDLRFLQIGELNPAVLPVPLFAERLPIVELDFKIDRKDKVAFAVNPYSRFVDRLALLLFGVLLIPVHWVGTHAHDFVVEDL